MSENIDKIIYINLNKRTDRRAEIEEELNKFNLPFERFEAIETPTFGTLGCCKSHLAVLKLAKERGYKNVLILEDDFTFLVSKETFEEQLARFFYDKIDYDVLMLSYNEQKQLPSDYEYVFKILYVQTASGYIVNQACYDTLINLYEYAVPLLESTSEHWNYTNDAIWNRIIPNRNWFGFVTRMGKQRPSYSDNGCTWADYGV